MLKAFLWKKHPPGKFVQDQTKPNFVSYLWATHSQLDLGRLGGVRKTELRNPVTEGKKPRVCKTKTERPETEGKFLNRLGLQSAEAAVESSAN